METGGKLSNFLVKLSGGQWGRKRYLGDPYAPHRECPTDPNSDKRTKVLLELRQATVEATSLTSGV